MPRKFANIPQVNANNTVAVVRALGDVLGFVTAQTQDVITPLAATATTAEAVAKINEIIARLQGT